MRVTAKIVAHLADKSRLKAIATVCLNNEFLITGVRVLECEKGPRVFMPSRKNNAGEYRDICFPITPELYSQIKDNVAQGLSQPDKRNNPGKVSHMCVHPCRISYRVRR